MALTGNRLAVGTALAAMLSMVVTPVLAADIPLPRAAHAAAPADDIARNRRHHRDRGVDAGDVIAGVLILGGIAAIVGAASKADRRDRDYRDYPEPQPYPEDPRYGGATQPYRGDYPTGGQSSGMDGAVDMCVAEVERSAQVGSVDGASRMGDGWYISGETGNGAPWTCRIGNDGRISDVDLGDGYRSDSGGGYDSSPSQGQYDDEAYARARAQMGTQQPGY